MERGNDSSNGKGNVNSEVTEKPVRRQFSREYKKRILEEADRCAGLEELGSLLRREGLYRHNLYDWRSQRKRGELDGVGKSRGRKAKPEEQLREELKRERRKNDQLEEKLRKAETVIEVQKKVSELLGISLPNPSEDENC